MQVGNKFEYYTCCFTDCLVVFFIIVEHFVDKNIWCELCRNESFFDKIFLDGFDCGLFLSRDYLLTSLLLELAHGIRFPFWVVYQAVEDDERFVLSLYFL